MKSTSPERLYHTIEFVHVLVRDDFHPEDEWSPKWGSVEWSPGEGVQVLYGLNGVGKSRLLQAIPSAHLTLRVFAGGGPLNGAEDWVWPQSRSWLHAAERLRGGDPAGVSDYLLEGSSFGDAPLMRELESFVSDFEFVDEYARSDWILAVLMMVVSPWGISEGLRHTVVDAIREIMDQCLVTVSSTEMHYRAVVSSDTPALREVERRARRAIEEAQPDTGNAWWDDIYQSSGTGHLGIPILLREQEEQGWYSFMWSNINSSAPGTAFFSRSLEGAPRFERPPLTFITDELSDLRSMTESSLARHATRLRDEANPDLPSRGIPDWKDLPRNVAERRLRDMDLYELTGDRVEITEWAHAAATELSAVATRHYRKLLRGAFELRVRFNSPADWSFSGSHRWEALDPVGTWVTLDALSAMQRRWANFAIAVATREYWSYPVILLDEPEMGLHRSAEPHLLDGIISIASEIGAATVIATHSPAFLRPDLCTLHHVQRSPGTSHVTVTRLDKPSLDRMEELGLTPSDFLQMTRTILLVEGEHDRWVLEGLFHEEFDRYGVLVMPIRGAKSLRATADAQLLFAYTTARVIVVLDNVTTERVERIWNSAIVERAAGAGKDRLLEILSDLRKEGSGESRWLLEFCSLAIEKQYQERLGFQMLPKADVIEYLPSEALVPAKRFTGSGDTAWEQLRGMHREAVDNGGRERDFKKWLMSQFGAKFDESTFKKAVAEVREIHADLTNLMRRAITPPHIG